MEHSPSGGTSPSNTKKRSAQEDALFFSIALIVAGFGFSIPVLVKMGAMVLVVFSLLPFLWRNRARLLNKLYQLNKRWMGGTDPQQGTYEQPISGTLTEQVAGEQIEKSLEQASEAYSSNGTMTAQLPFSLLPVNPRRQAVTSTTQETAGGMIASALQLCGFSVDSEVEVLSVEYGPTLQTVSFRLPSKVQLSALAKKRDDLANHLNCHSGFDVASSVFQSSAAFVLPNRERAYVYVRDVLERPEFWRFADQAQLPVIFGLDMLGKPLLMDIAKLPHLLVAGATNSGKSVYLNAILITLLLTCSPKKLKLLLIDPKMVELSVYNGFPHLLAPPITDMRRATLSLNKIIVEMEQRYERLAQAGVRNIEAFNLKLPNEEMSYIIVVIDEYADLMLVAGDEVEESVQRIAQKARAAGIHLILATQRPSVDVVTGIIKANLPSRVAFQLLSSHDFRTVMDTTGPKLMWYGDGVVLMKNGAQVRFQSASISVDDTESTTFIEELKSYWLRKAAPQTDMKWNVASGPNEGEGESDHVVNETESPSHDEEEQTYHHALSLLKSRGRISTDMMKHVLGIPFIKASSLMSRLDDEGKLGEFDPGSQCRLVAASKEASGVQTEEQLLDQLKHIICTTRNTRTADLQETLGIRKERVLQLMQELVREKFLIAPANNRSGYSIAWDETAIQDYLEQQNES